VSPGTHRTTIQGGQRTKMEVNGDLPIRVKKGKVDKKKKNVTGTRKAPLLTGREPLDPKKKGKNWAAARKTGERSRFDSARDHRRKRQQGEGGEGARDPRTSGRDTSK